VYETSVTVHGITSAPSTATLTVTTPDQQVQTLNGPWTWEQDGTDWTASYDYLLTQPGAHRFAWVTQGPGTAPPPEYENVRNFISMVSTSDVHQHLNMTSTASDDELARYKMAATELVEAKVGTCVPRQFTDPVDARTGQTVWELVLPHRPIMSIVQVASVLPSGPVWTPPTVAADADAGTVYQPGLFPFFWGPWDVTYTCGRAVYAERHIQACLEQIRHLWETQRGSMPPALLQGEEVFTATSGWSFTVPRRVLELVEEDMVPSI